MAARSPEPNPPGLQRRRLYYSSSSMRPVWDGHGLGELLPPPYGLEPDEITMGASALPIPVAPAAFSGRGPP